LYPQSKTNQKHPPGIIIREIKLTPEDAAGGGAAAAGDRANAGEGADVREASRPTPRREEAIPLKEDRTPRPKGGASKAEAGIDGGLYIIK